MNMEELDAAEAAAEGSHGGQDGGGGTQATGTTAREWSTEEWEEWNQRWSSRAWDPWSRSHWNGMSTRESDGPSRAAGVSGSQPPGRGDSERATATAPREGWHQDDWWQSKWWSPPQQKGDFADPPSWGGWPNFRLWKRAVSRWDRNTDVATWRRAEKLLKTFEWDLQSKLDHIPERILAGETYLQSIFEVMDTIAGEKESSEKRRCVRAALCEGSRQQGESLASYAMRREAQFLGAEKYMTLPDDLKAFMLEEQSGLNRQGVQNLRVLTGGKHNYSEVQQALKVLDTEEESIFKTNSKTSHYLETGVTDDTSGATYFQDKEIASDSEDDEDLMFFAIEETDLHEGEALSFIADWVNKKRTWKENRQWKASRKKDRRHFDSRESRARRPEGQRRLSVEELKKVTRCSNCHQKGHWREDCTQPLRPRDGQGHGGYDRDKNKGKNGAANPTGFAFLGLSKTMSDSSFSHWSAFGLSFAQVSEDGNASLATWLSIPGGEAIVDPGASQDLIGVAAFEKLRARLAEVNLKPIVLDEAPSDASGIGGKARPLFMALTPCCLGGFPGVVKLTILEEDVPHLLSVGLLEMARSVIDTGENMIFFKAFGTESKLKRLNTGHRLIDVASWDGGEFPIPKQIADDYGLLPGSFNLTRAQSEYEGSCGRHMGNNGTGFQDYFHSLFQLESDDEGFVNDEFGNNIAILRNSSFSSGFPSDSKFRFCSVFVECGNYFVSFITDVERQQGFTGCELHDRFETVVCFFTTSNFNDATPHHVTSVFRRSKRCDIHHKQNNSYHSRHFDKAHVSHSARYSPKLETCDQAKSIDRNHLSAEHVGSEEDGRWLVEDTRWRENHVRAGLRECQKPLVPHGAKAVDHYSQDGQPSPASGWVDRCGSAGDFSGGMLSSSGQDCPWSKSVWEMDEMQSVQEQADLRGLQRIEPTDQRQEDQGGNGICRSTQGYTRSEDKDQEQECRQSQLHGHLEPRVERGLGEASGIPGEWHPTGIDSFCSRSTSNAADDAGNAELAVQRFSSRTCGSSGRNLCGAFRRGDGEPQPGRLGSAALSLASLVRQNEVSLGFVTGESKHWFAQPLDSRSLVKHFSFPMNQRIWQDDGGNVWLVWYDASLGSDLCLSDNFDDREFQVTHKQKRLLKRALENEFLTNNNSRRHFVSSLHVEPNAATRSLRQQGEDLRTSKVLEEQGEDLSTSRPIEQQGEDLRTSRNHQEAEGPLQETLSPQQEAQSPNQFAAVSGDPMIREALVRSIHGSSQCLVLCELFSPLRVCKEAQEEGFRTTEPPAFDRLEGWEFFDARDRSHFWEVVRRQEPDLILMTPDCKAFSQMMESNWDRMDEEKKKAIQKEGLQMLLFCIEVAEYQLSRGKYFLIEQPAGASSWTTHGMAWLLGQPGVLRFIFDQCATGLGMAFQEINGNHHQPCGDRCRPVGVSMRRRS